MEAVSSGFSIDKSAGYLNLPSPRPAGEQGWPLASGNGCFSHRHFVQVRMLSVMACPSNYFFPAVFAIIQ